jgi:hypothetical protein
MAPIKGGFANANYNSRRPGLTVIAQLKYCITKTAVFLLILLLLFLLFLHVEGRTCKERNI